MPKDNRSVAEKETDGTPFLVKVERRVSPQAIGFALCGAFEGGSNYWLQAAALERSDFPKEKGLVWYGADHMFDGEFEFTVRYDHPDGEEGEGKGRKTITRADVLKGLELMAVKDPEAFQDLADLEHGNADGDTYDAFLQYVVLGGVVYG